MDVTGIALEQAVRDVLRHPTVASKSFLITIGDRTVGGMNARDQMVGPWQVPVADVAVTTLDYKGKAGEAMTMGERTPLAVIDAPASGRMAIGEALTNLAAAPVETWARSSCRPTGWPPAAWRAKMPSCTTPCMPSAWNCARRWASAFRSARIRCPCAPKWQDADGDKEVVAPVSLIISAFAAVDDVDNTLTPQLRTDKGDSVLIAIDLGRGKNRMGGSILAQVTQQVGDRAPDVDNADDLKNFFNVIQRLNREGKLLAYHDRSDGGFMAAVAEMAFAGHCGVSLNVDMLTLDPDAGAGLRRRQELGAAGEQSAATTRRCARCSPKNWAP